MSEFSQKLKEFRERQRKFKNSTAFYKALGSSQPTGSRYESGETEPDLSFLNKLLEVFGREALHLMPGNQEVGLALAESTPNYSHVVTGALPEHVESAYLILCEVLDLKKKTPADGDRKAVARILGKAARELARGEPVDLVRREILEDAELFLRILK